MAYNFFLCLRVCVCKMGNTKYALKKDGFIAFKF